jgi:hypothetical protein
VHRQERVFAKIAKTLDAGNEPEHRAETDQRL